MKFKKFKKIVFLVFGSNHRISALGNFGKSKMYKDILLISLGGDSNRFLVEFYIF